ncbi:MAG: Menaquinone biosynthesis protein [Cenarchaeum symbiont of Oopsacas minuta]|nr:Menaquinone biosynthesis protein [Cenarchaeum symbiont of Oopsacas minuta]
MEITVGHTPDSDDAFMFYGMLEGKIPSPDFQVKHIIGDIEDLNKRAIDNELDVTAVSVHACAYMPEYVMLRSGGSFGIGYGPIVTARKDVSIDLLKELKIAIPGKMTSAYLLLRLMIGEFEYKEMNFSDIPSAVAAGVVDAGLIIHETQISYDSEGIKKIVDVGSWWDKMTRGLPVPLGINVMRESIGVNTIRRFDSYLQESIQYALNHEEDALEYAMQYSRGKSRELISKFVKMYVNSVTVNMGVKGEESIKKLFKMSSGIVPKYDPKII